MNGWVIALIAAIVGGLIGVTFVSLMEWVLAKLHRWKTRRQRFRY